MSPSAPRPLAPDPATYRTVLGHFATGVVIVTAFDGDEEMDRIGRDAAELGARMGIPEVTVARDGLQLHLAAHPAGKRATGGQ